MKTLQELSIEYKADKFDLGYIKHYESRFEPIRSNVTKVLEIGVETGKSHRMWLEYFPNATVYGLDVFNEFDRSNYVTEFNRLQKTCKDLNRSVIFKGDQENSESLNNIIEDLHACSGQWKTLYGYEVIQPGDTLTTDLLNEISNNTEKILETKYLSKNDIENIKHETISCTTEIGIYGYKNFTWPSLISFIQKK